MRRTTVVVAVLAAAIASANAAPNNERLLRGTSGSTKSEAKVSRTVNASVTSASGAAFTAHRSAAAASAPSAAKAPEAGKRKVARTKREASRRAVRQARAHQPRKVRAARKAPAVAAEPVALRREVDLPSPSTVASAPTGSIPALVTQMAREAGVSPALAHAVVKVESRYQPRATGPGGYIGLMQLSYRTARGMGFRGSRQALYEPRTNLRYGMKYLAGAVAKSGGSTCGAVSKYQGGHGVRGVTKAGAVYCSKVKRFMAAGIPAGGRSAKAEAPKSATSKSAMSKSAASKSAAPQVTADAGAAVQPTP
ncbi:soluble lytic murein transglycosylase-like protein [Methylopila jiangsuensis]|nr:transglycosylase SLT domain-containing protein [Methylopila jiangsuensis]MDR6286282.1 soluble lytic murein transglycosylase-like protein [Methylopila jiangsuensis]